MNRPTEIEPRLKAHNACVMLLGYKSHNCVVIFLLVFWGYFFGGWGGMGRGVVTVLTQSCVRVFPLQ